MRFIIILNEEAGKAAKTAPGTAPDELRAAFTEAGIEAEVRVAAPDKIEETLSAAVAERPDAVIIGGGDGTVRSAAAALADTGIPLGVLPLGTFNHFAKDLKIPLDVKEAVAALAGGAVRDVDLGEVNGHVFINNCSIGAYAEAVRRRDALRDRRGLAKWWAMWRASFEEFRRLRRLRLRIKVERADPSALSVPSNTQASALGSARSTFKSVRTPVVVIGNNRYSGHLLSQHLRPRLDEGNLWLYTVHARRHLAVVRMMFQSLFGQLDEADALAAEPATEILIESDCGPLPVAADGEILKLTAPLRFRIRPGALRVLAPPFAEASAGKPVEEGATGSNVGSVLAPTYAREVGASAAPTAVGTSREETTGAKEFVLVGGVLHPDSAPRSRRSAAAKAMADEKAAPTFRTASR